MGDYDDCAGAVGVPVVYHDAGFCAKYPCAPSPLYHILERADCKYVVVIGNIYDTPELLAEARQ